ncbi:MAG: RagB/SusD family nutrient uptake outer membrane protein [Mucilaginibacter sp.]|uniref:RagB/SusD family nutrient uptake outer membrane protein n=1 Tax=Mucilaginibacter sp. TaxID=1882438 RepID=UPI0032666CF1
MHSYTKKYYILLLSISLLSCRKYVESVPIQGQRVLEYTDDYRALMNYSDLLQPAFGQAPVLSSDDLDYTADVLQSNIKANTIQRSMYTWRKPFYVDLNSDNDWAAIYSCMYTLNTVINQVMVSKGGSEVVKSNILAEALVHRAFGYFMLANLYGKQYDIATADKDPAVPLLLEPKLFVDLTRASVLQVYSKVIEDTKKAIPMLPLKQDINFRPNKASAYALLSKVYLFMRDFTKAEAYADNTLALSSDLYNYNTSLNSFPSQYNDKQVLLRKTSLAYPYPMQLSGSLLNLLGVKDLRYSLFVKPGTNFFPVFPGLGYWSRENYSGYPDKQAVGLSVNETWLIKAECLARAGKKDEAVKMLNTLRKMRFLPADYADIAAATNEEALQLVINERRLEFFGTGLRWFDQKRLNKDPMFAKAATRVFDGVTYTLEPNSNGYVFPLANILISQNPEMVQNPN